MRKLDERFDNVRMKDDRTTDDDPETAENIARSVRLTMPVMGIHPHNQEWINDHIARLVELVNER